MHESTSAAPSLTRIAEFGKLPDGRMSRLYTLTHPNGLRACVSDFGATLVSLETPDNKGHHADIILGYDSVEGYLGDPNPYLGATVGRYGNRIAGGRFTLDGRQYTLATNNDPAGILCHLHGGDTGFSHVLWTAEPATDGRSILFTYLSKDGEEGYPGNLAVRVTYTLSDDGELIWEATATTDAPTPVNIIHHSYWNLSGDPTTSIRDHELTLFADHFLPTGPGMIPTGEIAPVAGTPMDFTATHTIGTRIDEDFEALQHGHGYDHCWVLSGPRKDGMALAARIRDPKSGRAMEISTDQPAVQCYTSNWVDVAHFSGENSPGKKGHTYGHRSACCLETENFPDAPNQPSFPDPILRPGETYRHRMAHRFLTD